MHHWVTYMYINFQQNRVNRSVIIVHTNLFPKKSKLHKLATTNNNFEKIDHFRHASWVTYMYINFQQNQVNRLVIIVHTNLFPPKKASYINWQLPIVIFKKSTLLDMHHRKTYMYISFQQNRASRSVKTVHTNLFAKYCNLHIFATSNSNFEKSILSDMNHLIIHI